MIATFVLLVAAAVVMAWWTRPVTFVWPCFWRDPDAVVGPPDPDPARIVPIVEGRHADITWGAEAATAHYLAVAVATGRLLPPDDTGLVSVEVHVPSGWRAPLVRHRIRTRSLSGDWRPVDGDIALIGIVVVTAPGARLHR